MKALCSALLLLLLATAVEASARGLYIPPTQQTNKDYMESNRINLQIGDTTFTATLADNSSAEALLDRLKTGSITIDMEDYARMEKVGSLGTTLPRNDRSITTEAGDLILYQGRYFVIYYDRNSYPLTRLGKIDGVSPQALRAALGSGNVTVTLSLPRR